MSKQMLKLSGLVPVWEFAVSAGVEEAGLIQSLRTAGVPLLEILVSGRRAAFADAADLTAFVYKSSSPSGPPNNRSGITSGQESSVSLGTSTRHPGEMPGDPA